MIACFAYAYRENVHMTMSASVKVNSESCGGISETGANFSEIEKLHFIADSRFSVCAGDAEAKKIMTKAYAAAEAMGISAGWDWGFINLKGEIKELYSFYLKLQELLENVPCTADITFSVNSPTPDWESIYRGGLPAGKNFILIGGKGKWSGS